LIVLTPVLTLLGTIAMMHGDEGLKGEGLKHSLQGWVRGGQDITCERFAPLGPLVLHRLTQLSSEKAAEAAETLAVLGTYARLQEDPQTDGASETLPRPRREPSEAPGRRRAPGPWGHPGGLSATGPGVAFPAGGGRHGRHGGATATAASGAVGRGCSSLQRLDRDCHALPLPEVQSENWPSPWGACIAKALFEVRWRRDSVTGARRLPEERWHFQVPPNVVHAAASARDTLSAPAGDEVDRRGRRAVALAAALACGTAQSSRTCPACLACLADLPSGIRSVLLLRGCVCRV